MGFPHEECARDQVRNEILTTEDGRTLLDTVRTCSDSDLVGMGFEPLTVGFANHVWATKKYKQQVVVKRYTDLAFLRLDAEAIGCVDVHSGENGVGPRVLYSSSQGLVMERLDGRTLEEEDMHKDDKSLMALVAKALGKLHSLPVPKVCDGTPMLWRTIDKMMEVASRKPELWPQEMPSMEVVLEEVEKTKVVVKDMQPRVVLCHGDLKPSNVIYNKSVDEVHIIDHELAGPNYRAFDLMKLFRTAGKQSDTSMEHFLQSYCETMDAKPDVAKIKEEARIFEPLTWLEAACFFLALPQFKPQDTARWNSLALDRWDKYQATKAVLL
jgi:thiamine kinase-like enzyme